jgi:YfiH family protein
LNLGGTVGDDSARVFENRQRAFAALQLRFDSQFDVWQVHSDRVVVAHGPRTSSQEIQQADAILTDRPGVTLFMRFADCVPVYLYDPRKQVVGLAHAGWIGTIKRIAGNAGFTMVHGSQPEEIILDQPSIAAHHYPVGADTRGPG